MKRVKSVLLIGAAGCFLSVFASSGAFAQSAAHGPDTDPSALAYVTASSTLEDYSGFEPLFRTTYRSDTADLVYAARDKSQNLAVMLEASVQTFGSLDIVPPAFFPEDIREVSPGEWAQFIACAAAAGDYRTVVLDIGSWMQDVTELLEKCARCYVPILNDPVSRAKVSQFDRNMNALGKEVLLSSMVRIYLPEVTVRSCSAALLDDLAYGRMGQFARRLLEEEGLKAA